LKPATTSQLWVHVIGAWFSPEMSFLNDETMDPADGILNIQTKRFHQLYAAFDTTFLKSLWGASSVKVCLAA
jgi:hypothetical protein